MKETLITIGVPVFNGEQYLKRCLDSLVNQTYKNLEIIITNNGSTDNTQNIIDSYAKKDSRIKVIVKTNKQHAGPARTEQCRLSSGEFICFCDADDFLELDFIQTMIAEGDTYDYYIADWYKFSKNVNNKTIRRIPFAKNILNRDDILGLQKTIVGDSNIKSPMDLDLYSSLCGKLYRTSIINENKLIVMSSGELGGADDALFNVDYLEYAKSAVKINRPLYNYFSNPQSFSHTHKIEDIYKFELQYKEFEKRLNCYKKSAKYFDALSSRVFVQSFGAFIIIETSKSTKKERARAKQFICARERLQKSFNVVDVKNFSAMFRPFFKNLIKGRLKMCSLYINLALLYKRIRG